NSLMATGSVTLPGPVTGLPRRKNHHTAPPTTARPPRTTTPPPSRSHSSRLFFFWGFFFFPLRGRSSWSSSSSRSSRNGAFLGGAAPLAFTRCLAAGTVGTSASGSGLAFLTVTAVAAGFLTSCGSPQAGHLIRLPTSPSSTFRNFPQLHSMRSMDDLPLKKDLWVALPGPGAGRPPRTTPRHSDA